MSTQYAGEQHSESIRAICFCADLNYLPFVAPVIESISRADSTAYQIHIITNRYPANKIREAIGSVLGKNDVTYHVIDEDKYLSLKEVAHFSRAMYYRLAIPRLVYAKKILYLDCDILVRNPLIEIFNINLGENYLAAVCNPFFKRKNIVPAIDYFNSGVMLINRDRWLSDAVENQVISLLRKNPDILQMPDQDALNIVVDGAWHRLHPKFNAQASMFHRYNELASEPLNLEDCEFLKNPSIVHFSGSTKQWHYSCASRFSNEYITLQTSIRIPKRGILIDHSMRFLRFIFFRFFKRNPYY